MGRAPRFDKVKAPAKAARKKVAEARANVLRDEVLADLGYKGTEAPRFVDGQLNDGEFWEAADLSSEAAVRAQVRAWIDPGAT